MYKLSLIVLILVTATLVGCAGACGGDKCGSFEARCCGWELYKKCDLIEGKRGQCDIDPCAVEITPCDPAPVVEEAPPVIEAAPAAEEAPVAEGDAGAPVADYGQPPAGR